MKDRDEKEPSLLGYRDISLCSVTLLLHIINVFLAYPVREAPMITILTCVFDSPCNRVSVSLPLCSSPWIPSTLNCDVKVSIVTQLIKLPQNTK